MKRAVLVVAALVFAAFIVPASRLHGAVAAAATPTPAALQYDEISRMIVPPATPPAPGTFQTDYQNIVGSSGDQHHGLNGVVNSIMGNPQEMMERMSRGNLTQYTFYKGWIRTDNVVEHMATIEKCQEHQYITLYLDRKVYSVADTQPPCPTPQGMPAQAAGAMSRSQPGTADMTISGTSNNLGPLTIDGIGTVGYDQSLQMKTANATGSCRNNDFAMQQTRYISQIRVPRAYCPLPRTMAAGGMMARSGGGCEPRMHVAGTLAGMNDADRLVMYQRMALGQNGGQSGAGESGDSGPPGGMNMVIERGNVKWFGGADADALFAIPAGFTKQ